MNWESILQRQQGWTLENADELRLSIEEASEIYENAPLHELTMAADIRRKKLHPDGKVTYLVDRNVNYTNVCTINCQFCSFYRPPGHDETYTPSYDLPLPHPPLRSYWCTYRCNVMLLLA